MAEKTGTPSSGEKFEGHGDNTDKLSNTKWQSPGTFVPLSPTPTSANEKSADLGRKGSLLGNK